MTSNLDIEQRNQKKERTLGDIIIRFAETMRVGQLTIDDLIHNKEEKPHRSEVEEDSLELAKREKQEG